MPVSVVVLTHIGLYARFLQESIKSEIGSYYVMAARANGVDEREVKRGVMRNSFIPYLNYLGITIPSFFGGSVIVESLFSWPGLGQLLVKSVMVKDYPLLMGGIMLTGLIVVISLFTIDVIMYILDPKLRRGELDG